MQELTDREKQVFDYIYGVKVRDRISPTVRDIQKELGFKSTSSVQTIIQRLRDKGYLKNTKRTGGCETQEKNGTGKKGVIDLSEGIIIDGGNPISVPVLGVVAAGKPILATENHMYYIDYPRREGFRPQNDLFGLIVRGESMIGAGIMNGDIIIFAKTGNVENGDIVVAMIDGEATVKRFYKENGHFRLQPENPEMKPIIVNELTILGKVMSVVRYYS